MSQYKRECRGYSKMERFYNDEDLKKIQNLELEMLKEFIDFCEKHDLTYFLIAGSALGAVRHNGFIPWDDDLDIGMPREDYEKLSEIREDIFYAARGYLRLGEEGVYRQTADLVQR